MNGEQHARSAADSPVAPDRLAPTVDGRPVTAAISEPAAPPAQAEATEVAATETPQAVVPASTETPAVETSPPEAVPQAAETASAAAEAHFDFHADQPTAAEEPGAEPAGQPLEWSASDRAQANAGRPALLAVGALVLAALVYLLTHDMLSAGAIVLVAVFLLVLGMRKPRIVRYRIDPAGIAIERKYYQFGQFRSFSVDADATGPAGNLMLMPLQRFMPILTISYSHDIEAQIIGLLSERLPMEEHRRDAMDMLIQKLRF